MASFNYPLLFMVLTFTGQFSPCFGKNSRKELRHKEAHFETVIQNASSIQTNRVDPSRVFTLSWRPRVFLYKGFLTDEECDHLISLAQATKETSEAKDDDSARNVNSRLLTTSSSLLNMDDKILSRIEERISAWTLLPKENSMGLQIMHYGTEDSKHNFDYFGNKSAIISSEPLMATLILYLLNVTRGGEILFPKSEVKNKIWSDCTEMSNTLKPVKGNAIFFFTVHLNSSPDTGSSHSRCPVLEGEMWYATKTFHLRAVQVSSDLVGDGDECTDEDANCPSWAAIGECQRNPVYMVGSPDYYGTCRKSCNAC